MAVLPASNLLNIDAFEKLFDRTTNSYKYLFFLGLIDILRQREFEVESIALKDIVVEMLLKAWQAHHDYQLQFGRQDQIAIKLDELDRAIARPLYRARE
ncbi:MAG: hypothetical protein F6K28_62090, partial [Microcoleus sp. SIO2G3]|nr:hypothetical protein [Microcoleus sp. SIO2G3]